MEQSDAGLETSQNQQTEKQSSSEGEQNAKPDMQQVERPARASRTAKPDGNANESAEPKRLSLAELFQDDADGNGESSSVDDDTSKPPESIEQVVKRLGLKPEQVYAIKVPMPNGAEAVTIGDLKDRVGELVELETRETEFETRRIRQEGDVLRAQTELRDIMAMLPRDQIKPEVVEKIRKRHEAVQTEERRRTLEVIPQWRDDKTRLADITGMIAHLSDYGFDEGFLNTVVDHRALKYMRDMYLRDKRIKAALAKVVTEKPNKSQRPSGKPAKGAVKPARENNSRRSVTPTQRDRIMNMFDNAGD